MSLVRTVAPTDEPLSQTQAKDQLKIETSVTADDTYIDDCISDAVNDIEELTERALIDQTWEWKLDCFPIGHEPFRVPRPPLSSVTSIAYLDSDGASQTLATSVYEVDTASDPGRIALKFEQVWPIVRSGDVIDVVTVTFVAGYGSSETAMPGLVLRVMREVVTDYYANRGDARTPIAQNPTLRRLLWSLRANVRVA